MRFYHLSLVLLLVMAGCDVVGPEERVLCSAVATPAIIVEVRNAETDAPEAESVEGVITDGGYIDSLRIVGYTEEDEPVELAAGYQRPGIYDVRIEKRGFETWTRQGVNVEAGTCGPETQQLDAHLVPNSAPPSARIGRRSVGR